MNASQVAGEWHPRDGTARSIGVQSGRGWKLVALLAASVAAPMPELLLAQNVRPVGVVAGIVRDSGGARLVGAELRVVGSNARAFSNDTGGFRILGVPTGEQLVLARRLGFSPSEGTVAVDSGGLASLSLTLARVPVELTSVTVTASARPVYTGWAAGFFERRDRGMGRYVSAEEIQRRGSTRVTDVMRTLPGVSIRSSRYASNTVFLRGRSCPPFIWVDGSPAMAGYFDIDALDPQSLEGIEVYSSLATVPAELSVPIGKMQCGMIALWTRMPERKQRRIAQAKYTANDLAAMVRSLKAYTADQVDTPARADPEATFTLNYPAAQREAGTSGSVIVEFVVDVNGRPEMDTFGVVSASLAEFVVPTRTAVAGARFLPAELDGVRVRQVVQLPVRFEGNDPRHEL